MNTATSANYSGPKAVILIFMSAFFQGLALVSFPALGTVLKAVLYLSDTVYGAIFLPQVAMTAVGAIAAV